MTPSQRQSLIDHLRASLKTAYQQALDADRQLDALASENLAQFDAVLKPGQGFDTEANRFKPYVEELAQQLLTLEKEDDIAPALAEVTKQLQLLLHTLARFKRLQR
ncbi:hypothetical protein [Gallaecimonas sp. GXIMD1310]|uniref:hypothetical protein n=1 Tax=Gallaecimonas sp. GXIMD1310 TaxID=3131926 RepID=UPI00324E1ED5